jgi:glycosyltransferase involved in cell wall biosynthesis
MTRDAPVGVLYVAHDTGLIGGAERQLLELFRGLDRSRYVPHLACLEPDGPVAARASAMGVEIHTVMRRWRYDLGVAFSVAGLVRSAGIAVVHAYLGLPGFYGALGGRLAGAAVITTIRTAAPTKRIADLTEKVGFLLSDRVIANSRAGVDYYFRHIPGRGKARVIYNGYNMSDFKPAPARPRRELGLPEDGLLVGHVANLTFIKDYPTFLRSMAIVFRRNAEAVAVIVGDGASRKPYEETARSLGIMDRTVFLGQRKDVLELVRAFDICVLASHPKYSEGLSNSIAEYMGLGKPVVATAVGGNGELVRDGINGFLRPPGDPEALAAAILELAASEDLRHRMGAEGREFFENNLSLERMVGETQAVYEELIR